VGGSSAEERAIAQMALANLPLKIFLKSRWYPTKRMKSRG
jgi:hypothetical protein